LTTQEFTPKRPVKEFHHWGWGGGVRLAVWKNPSAYSFQVSKRIKDKEGKYIISQTLFAEDVAALALLCNQALMWCSDQYLFKKEQGRSGEIIQDATQAATALTPPDDIPF
jgi:hypothetical protein